VEKSDGDGDDHTKLTTPGYWPAALATARRHVICAWSRRLRNVADRARALLPVDVGHAAQSVVAGVGVKDLPQILKVCSTRMDYETLPRRVEWVTVVVQNISTEEAGQMRIATRPLVASI
jgi:hypothetical protein